MKICRKYSVQLVISMFSYHVFLRLSETVLANGQTNKTHSTVLLYYTVVKLKTTKIKYQECMSKSY